MPLLTRVKNFEQFANKHKDDKEISIKIKSNSDLESLDQIEKVLSSYQDENKLLRIGIVGRVKAGKSSLLNALIFDGEDVLPKAATPMTAALTIMKYSEQMRAEVDFFSDEDLKKLKEEHQQYKEHSERLEAEEIAVENAKRPEKQDEEKAKRRAARRLKDSPYAAGADQYERIEARAKSSGASVDSFVNNLKEHRNISASSMAELNQKLSEFVGANGKYMPFTKSVTLYLPEPKLEGLEIVDTPGINDPVQSRGKRTEDLLSQCDVVLMVSPTGQFLSEQDTALMSNMTRFKGIGNVYLVASQCDNQLMGSEYRGQEIQPILNKIGEILGKHAKDTLLQEKKKYPEMEAIFNQFTENELILTSGACYGLAKYFDQPHKWDETQQHIHRLLSENFPQNFSSKEKSLATLNTLSNTEKIQTILDDVHQKKNEIFKEKTAKYREAQLKALFSVLDSLDQLLKDKQDELRNNTVESILEQQTRFDNLRMQVDNIVSREYQESKSRLEIGLQSTLSQSLKQQMNRFVRGEKETGYTEREESYSVKVGERSTSKWWNPFSWGDTESIYETRYRTVRDSYSYVRATPVRESILAILDILNKQLSSRANDALQDSKDALQTVLRDNLYKLDSNNFNTKRIKLILEQVLDKLPKAQFNVDSLPSHLDKYGELKGSEGERFLKDAQEYISQLERNVQNQIDNYVRKLSAELAKVNLSQEFIRTFEEKLKDLQKKMKNADEEIKRYQQMSLEVSKI